MQKLEFSLDQTVAENTRALEVGRFAFMHNDSGFFPYHMPSKLLIINGKKDSRKKFLDG